MYIFYTNLEIRERKGDKAVPPLYWNLNTTGKIKSYTYSLI